MAFEFVGLQGPGCSLLVSQAPSKCLSHENVWKSQSTVSQPAQSWWMLNSVLTWIPNSSLHSREGPCHGIAKVNCFVWAWYYYSSWGSLESMWIQNSERSISWALNKRPVSRAVLPPANQGSLQENKPPCERHTQNCQEGSKNRVLPGHRVTETLEAASCDVDEGCFSSQ